MTDYKHRDLCSATSGIIKGLHKMAQKERSDLDPDTVEAVAKHFQDKHEEIGAETPTPDLD
jgi:hypothetical protein